MTETYTADTPADEIDTDDLPSARLDRQADAFLDENRSFETRSTGEVRPVHEALREDALAARDWGKVRAERLRGAVEAEPVRASLYALGLGVVIGMLINR